MMYMYHMARELEKMEARKENRIKTGQWLNKLK